MYPADFIVLDTCPNLGVSDQAPIILGRPFLATIDSVIKVRNGNMSITFGNMTLDLNIYNVASQLGDDEEIHEVNLIESLIKEHVNTQLYSEPLEPSLPKRRESFLNPLRLTIFTHYWMMLRRCRVLHFGHQSLRSFRNRNLSQCLVVRRPLHLS